MEEKKLHIYNTMSRQKEEFIPLMKEWKKDFVWIYSCGPTVYWNPHIWNMRAFAFADLLRNIIKNVLWYPTKHVMNLTDVGHLTDDGDEWEDKMEKWARRENKTVRELADLYIWKFYGYLEKLQIDKFDVMCRATDHIQEQITMIKTLEEKWYTYEIPNDWIYMDTSKVEDYWKLAWLENQERIAWARIQNDNKKNDTDFALWKFSPKDQKRQMERDSPWWVWFPGWHIECSAMSSKYLGEQFDIHHWWADHITIHHPNEIAQAECGFWKKPWVKYWLHNEFLQVDWGKMSKSLGNFYSLDDIKAKWYSPLDLRYFYFKAQYWNFQNFTWDALEQSKNERNWLIKKIANIIAKQEKGDWENWKEKFEEALADNINTPKLLSELHSAVSKWGITAIDSIKELEEKILKIWLFDSKDESIVEAPAEIIALADERKQAKADKNYALADELRWKIQEAWWTIKDTKDGYELLHS